LPKVVFDLDAVIITRELCVGIFDEIDCFIVLFSNGGLPKVAFEIKPPTGEPPQASPMGVLEQPKSSI